MPEAYMLNRDSDERRRLNDQHEVWVKNLGYDVHPRVVASMRPDAQIADVGTGTGIWLFDLARKHASWRFHGFDISDAQFDVAKADALSVQFHRADIREPFAQELHGRFDLVHVRLLILALRPHEWKLCVANLKTLLKPGGWIQWEEINVDPMREVLRANAAAKTTILKGALKNMFESGGPRIKEALEGLQLMLAAFRENHMRDVEEDVVSSERVLEMRKLATMVEVGVLVGVRMQQIAGGIAHAGTLEELEETRKQIGKEVDGGAYLQFYIHCAIGKM